MAYPRFTKPSTHYLNSFRPIIDTTGTAYQPVAKYLTKLLNPITTNEFTIKDSLDAVTHINNIPHNLFNDGYRQQEQSTAKTILVIMAQ